MQNVQLHVKCISLGEQCRKKEKKILPPVRRTWMCKMVQRRWYLSRSRTGNHDDVFTLCLFFLAFAELLSPPVMWLTISYSLTLASSKSIYRRLRLTVVTGIWNRILLWNGPWEMREKKRQWEGWEISRGPIYVVSDLNHKSPFFFFLKPETLLDPVQKCRRFGATMMRENMKWP